MSVPSIVTHCGSTKFGDAFAWANHQDTLAGRVVLSIGCVTQPDSELFAQSSPEQAHQIKVQLDQLHLRKIDISSEVLAINHTGYIGASTLHELCYAYNRGIPIRWLEDWLMYCLSCRIMGPESEHFFHTLLSISEVERLIADERTHPYLEGQLVEWLGQVAPVVRLESGQFALQVDLPCVRCKKSYGTQQLLEHEGAFAGLLLLPDGRVIDYYNAQDRYTSLLCPNCAATNVPYCIFTTKFGNSVNTIRISVHALPRRLVSMKEMILAPGFTHCQVVIGLVTYIITPDRGEAQMSACAQVPMSGLPATHLVPLQREPIQAEMP